MSVHDCPFCEPSYARGGETMRNNTRKSRTYAGAAIFILIAIILLGIRIYRYVVTQWT
ncbi:hypothetical protein AAC03nite_27630 [Alicyclobacillus acidoterrestris]|nr:hypothetical protein AAC03nite_27630 [Alicyclobacillus acidoterrestris]